MSILAKLLNKNEPIQAKGDIPPGVVQAVNESAGKVSITRGTDRRKFLVVGLLATIAVVSGALLVLYFQLNTPARPLPQSQPVMTTMPLPQQAVQKPVSAVASAPSAVPPHKEKVRLTQFASVTKRAAPSTTPAAAPAPSSAKEPAADKKTLPRDRATSDAYLFAARNAEAKGDYLQALNSYRKALEADPGNYKIMNNVASAMLHLGMYREALAQVQQILAIRPEYVSAMVNGGIAQYRLGLLSEARSWFERATATDPSHREALYNLALLQEKSGSLDEALESYRRLSGGGDPRGTLGMARILEWRQDKGEALRLYRDILTLPDVNRQIREAARERVRVLDR